MIGLPFRRGGIGVLEVFGVIGGAVKEPVHVRLLDTFRQSHRIRSVVLDIDSPGGTVAASESLHTAAAKLAAAKPVVAYVRGIGASGAYMLGCSATKVVANPGAIVGSIGVISLRPIVEELMRKLGVSVSVTKAGRLKDMGSPFRAATEEEKQKDAELVNDFYEHFLQVVAQGRRLDVEKVRELATGEVFSGRKALSLGLVDELGDMDRALELAAELGKVPVRPFYLRPRRPFVERLFASMSISLAEELANRLEAVLLGRMWYR